MGKYTGTDLYVSFGGTDISGRRRSLEVSEPIDIIDASVGGETFKDKLTGQKDFTASYTCLDETGGTAFWAAIAPGTEGTLEWAPEGTAATKPKHYGTAIVSERSRPFPYDAPVEISVSFEGKSAVTDTVYS